MGSFLRQGWSSMWMLLWTISFVCVCVFLTVKKEKQEGAQKKAAFCSSGNHYTLLGSSGLLPWQLTVNILVEFSHQRGESAAFSPQTNRLDIPAASCGTRWFKVSWLTLTCPSEARHAAYLTKSRSGLSSPARQRIPVCPTIGTFQTGHTRSSTSCFLCGPP